MFLGKATCYILNDPFELTHLEQSYVKRNSVFPFILSTTGHEFSEFVTESSEKLSSPQLWEYPLPFFVLGTIIILSIPWIIKHKKVPNKHPEGR